MFCARSRWMALFCCLLPLTTGRAEVIYDNTQIPLSNYATEAREYGDQVDLEGTARTLTELTFYYYGEFVPTGDESMKVRLYSNESPYDIYRNAPTRLLYESGNLPLINGYNSRTIRNLNVKLPFDTLTFSIEFKGLNTNEVAGLLLYGPPTVGSSFNEFWGRVGTDRWLPFYYSTTDFSRKANAGLKLVARPEAEPSEAQTNSAAVFPLHDGTNHIVLAQTFTPQFSGRLDTVTLQLTSTNAVTVSICDVRPNGVPNTNVTALRTVTPNTEGAASAAFYDGDVYLKAGVQYSLHVELASSDTNSPDAALRVSNAGRYAGGRLWQVQTNDWIPVFLSGNSAEINAAFSVSIVPAQPAVRIATPSADEVIPSGQPTRISAELNLPKISTLWRVRFFDGDQELQQVTKPPYQIIWPATNSGPHRLRVTVEDTFLRPFRAEAHNITVLDPPPPPVERFVFIEKSEGGAVRLQFDTQPGDRIEIMYSDDLLKWKNAQLPDSFVENLREFLDDGPPKTDSHPKDAGRRYYRVNFGD